MTERRAAVVAVHGTFSPLASWVEGSSPMMQRLIADFSSRNTRADIFPFRWSGANSTIGRRLAATQFTKLLRKLRETKGFDAIFVVAHSHGGTVVAQAMLDDPTLRELVAGFVALSTPWISVIPDRYASEHRRSVFRVGSFLLFAGLIPTMFPVIDFAIKTLMGPVPAPTCLTDVDAFCWDARMSHLFNAMGLAWVMVNGLAAALGIGWAILHAWAMRRVARSEGDFLLKVEALSTELDIAHAPLPPTAVLIANRDEASAGLGALQWLATLGRELVGRIGRIASFAAHVLDRLPRYVRIFLSGLIFLAVAVTWGNVLLLHSVADGFGAPDWLIVSFGLAILTVAAAVFASGLSVLAFGGASMRASAFCRFGVEKIPFGRHEVVLVDTRTESIAGVGPFNAVLSHSSIYADESGIQSTLEALRKFDNDHEVGSTKVIVGTESRLL